MENTEPDIQIEEPEILADPSNSNNLIPMAGGSASEECVEGQSASNSRNANSPLTRALSPVVPEGSSDAEIEPGHGPDLSEAVETSRSMGGVFHSVPAPSSQEATESEDVLDPPDTIDSPNATSKAAPNTSSEDPINSKEINEDPSETNNSGTNVGAKDQSTASSTSSAETHELFPENSLLRLSPAMVQEGSTPARFDNDATESAEVDGGESECDEFIRFALVGSAGEREIFLTRSCTDEKAFDIIYMTALELIYPNKRFLMVVIAVTDFVNGRIVLAKRHNTMKSIQKYKPNKLYVQCRPLYGYRLPNDMNIEGKISVPKYLN